MSAIFDIQENMTGLSTGSSYPDDSESSKWITEYNKYLCAPLSIVNIFDSDKISKSHLLYSEYKDAFEESSKIIKDYIQLFRNASTFGSIPYLRKLIDSIKPSHEEAFRILNNETRRIITGDIPEKFRTSTYYERHLQCLLALKHYVFVYMSRN